MDDKFKLIIINEDSVDFYGNALEGSYHSQYLYDYIMERYSDDPVLSKLNSKVPADQLACFLVYLKHMAILLNETKFNQNGKSRYGNFGCLILPTDPSGKLINNILSVENLGVFNQVVLETVVLAEDNVLEDHIIEDYEDLPIKERLEKIYLNRQKKR